MKSYDDCLQFSLINYFKYKVTVINTISSSYQKDIDSQEDMKSTFFKKKRGAVIGMDNMDTSGTEKWIEVVLRELHEASTVEIVNRVSIFNQDCADRIPMVLTQMRMEGKVSYKVVQSKEGKRKNIVWRLESMK